MDLGCYNPGLRDLSLYIHVSMARLIPYHMSVDALSLLFFKTLHLWFLIVNILSLRSFVYFLLAQKSKCNTMSHQWPNFSTRNATFDMNEQQRQHHFAMSSQQPDLSTSKLTFKMNEQQLYKQPTFLKQRQLFP